MCCKRQEVHTGHVRNSRSMLGRVHTALTKQQGFRFVSIQAGLWNFDGEPANQKVVESLMNATAQHGPDGQARHVNGPVAMLYRPFHTTKESCLEQQPYVSLGNNVITWDGRLDNRDELAAQCDACDVSERADVGIVAAAFDKWGVDCFQRLLGEWALTVWNAREQVLILAKDVMGIRHLYYQRTAKRLLWCTTLEPIVLLNSGSLQVSGEFIVGYLAAYPPSQVTPYEGIASVPPASYVAIKQTDQPI